MPLPTNFASPEEVKRLTQGAVKSGYWTTKDIPDNGSAEMILCGEPDDHMVGGFNYWKAEDPCYTREWPSDEEWLNTAGPGYDAKKKFNMTREDILKKIKEAPNTDARNKALGLFDKRKQFLAFAAYSIERDDFIVVCLVQPTIITPLGRYLSMTKDYKNITKGGVYNFRLQVDKVVKDKTSYEISVRVHRAEEADQVKDISKRWEQTKDSIYLPRYFMEPGNNNVFDGKPDGAVVPPGLPVTAKDSYGADTELASF